MGSPEKRLVDTVNQLLGGRIEPTTKVEFRFARQQAIEDSLTSFRPTFSEACEILDALKIGLFKRYNDWLYGDLEADFKNLREALGEADSTQGPSDE